MKDEPGAHVSSSDPRDRGPRETAPSTDLYLELLKRALLGLLSLRTVEPAVRGMGPGALRWALQKMEPRLKTRNLAVIRESTPRDIDRRLEGRGWPPEAYTMVGMRRLDNLQACIETAVGDGVPGDLIETGVWRGGATIFMRGVLKVLGSTDRTVWVADSFQGLAPPNPALYPDDAGDAHHEENKLRVSLEQVRAHFARFDLLDEHVQFLEGWFRDTLHVAPIEQLAVLRLDGDMYESTWQALGVLYPKLAVGGFAIVDDFGLPACRRAVEDYRLKHDIDEPMDQIDWTGVFWRKTK